MVLDMGVVDCVQLLRGTSSVMLGGRDGVLRHHYRRSLLLLA